ncbi:LCP family protein [Nonomuraea sp. B1E8]|uniref:LCP family protein n=1 Tax=unclassified Nonomuraea TaxID=2593643 RepID=UPI00325EAB22
MSEDDRTRAMRSPGDGRPLPPRPNDVPRSGGAPAHRFPAGGPGAPTHKLPAASQIPEPPPGPPGSEPRRSSGRVYGRQRSGGGGGPVRPLRSRGGQEPREPRKRPSGRTIVKIVAGLLVALLVAAVGMFFWIDSRLAGIDDVLADYDDRPADGPGTNWLLVGSDSRKGLSKAERKKLATGRAVGQRTDSMMLLHIPDTDDQPTLVSLPRDLAVTIYGKQRDKLNAAYNGGPQLLVRTIETVTDLRVDNYMEIGFAGFVDIVDAVGGVEMNVTAAVDDPKAGLKLKKGKQVLNGAQALGYVRTRKGGALPDYERTKRQRQFLAAVVKKAASPGVLINPFTSIPLAMSATDAVTVDSGTGAFDLLSLGLAMGDSPVTTVVPFGGNENLPNGGVAVKSDRQKALALFNALKEDKPVPKSVLDAR